jgi:glyoxylase-like metal-dependent hydrolase (beta-lactamase superfamily II)
VPPPPVRGTIRDTEPALTGPLPLDETLLGAVARDLTPRVVQLDAGLWCLRLPLDYPRVTSVNAYLLELDEGWLLVDTGTRLDILHVALDAATVDPGGICAVLATHAHSDHSGLAAELTENRDRPLWRGHGPVMAVDALRDNAEPLADRQRHCRRAGVPEVDLRLMADALITGQLGTEGRRPADRELDAGDRLTGPHASWEVIALPGHAPAQVGLWDAAHRRLVGADIAYPSGIPFLEWGHSEDPLGEHLSSLRRAAALGPTLLLPGHGRPDPDPSVRLRASGRELTQLRERLQATVAARPCTAYELACALSPDNADPDRRQSELATVLATLDVLVAEGLLTATAPSEDDPRIYAADRPAVRTSAAGRAARR